MAGDEPILKICREEDDFWTGEVPALPGLLVHATSYEEAKRNTIALAFHWIGDRIERGDPIPPKVVDSIVHEECFVGGS